MESPKSAKLVHLAEAYNRVKGNQSTHASRKTLDKFIKDYKIEIAFEQPYGKGIMQLVSEDEVQRILQVQLELEQERGGGEAPATLHLGALESKVDRACQHLHGLTDAINILVKQTNIQADLLTKLRTEVSDLTAAATAPK